MALNLDQEQPTATTGMTKAIFERMREVMAPDLDGLGEEDIQTIEEGWKKMAFAVAAGVIEYLTANMEIVGIHTKGDVSATLQGKRAVATDVVFTQSNEGSGHVK